MLFHALLGWFENQVAGSRRSSEEKDGFGTEVVDGIGKALAQVISVRSKTILAIVSPATAAS